MNSAFTPFGCAINQQRFTTLLHDPATENKALVNRLFLFKRNNFGNKVLATIGDNGINCRVNFVSSYVPDFVEENCPDNSADVACSSVPRPETYKGTKCISISNQFKRFTLNIAQSACDYRCNIKGFSDPDAFVFGAMSQVVLKSHLLGESVFFNGLYESYGVCSDTDYRPMYNLRPGQIFSISGTNVTASGANVPSLIGTAGINDVERASMFGRVMFVDSDYYNKFLLNHVQVQRSCCSVFGGSVIPSDNRYTQFYVDPNSQIRMVVVPDGYIAYDPVTHRPIYPIVDTDLYGTMALGREGFKELIGFDQSQFSPRLTNLMFLGDSYMSILMRVGNTDMNEEMGMKISFKLMMGAMLMSPNAVSYLLGDAKTDNSTFVGRPAIDLSGVPVKDLFTSPNIVN